MSNQFDLPDKFGRFRILRVLGAGGMGTVYETHDTRLGSRIALKVPQYDEVDNPKGIERFRREAEFAKAVQHPYICPVYDFGEIDGVHYLTMPFVVGTPLNRLVGPGQVWPPRRAAELVRRQALALDSLHQQKVIHRDLKPRNIILRMNDEPMLMDLGIARDLGDDRHGLTSTGRPLGTPRYMAPEQVEGDPDGLTPATDVYGLGVVLYELLTGGPPFDSPNSYTLMTMILNSRPESPTTRRPDLDCRLESICLKMLEKRPEDRYRNMTELEADLSAYLRSIEVTVPGRWMARLEGNPMAEWEYRSKTPAVVAVVPGEVYRFEYDEDLDKPNESLAGLVRLWEFPNLRSLVLGQGVSDAGLAHLRGLGSLEQLELDYSFEITDSGLEHISALTGLRELVLESDQVTDAGLERLLVLTGLEHLGLGLEKITDDGLKRLRKLGQLKHLDLWYCEQITDAGFENIGKLTGLQHLGLQGCEQITDSGLKHILALTSLREFEWEEPGTGITDAGLTALRQGLPNCGWFDWR